MIFKQAQIDKYLKKNDPAIKAFVVYGSNEGLAAEYVKSWLLRSAPICTTRFRSFTSTVLT